MLRLPGRPITSISLSELELSDVSGEGVLAFFFFLLLLTFFFFLGVLDFDLDRDLDLDRLERDTEMVSSAAMTSVTTFFFGFDFPSFEALLFSFSFSITSAPSSVSSVELCSAISLQVFAAGGLIPLLSPVLRFVALLSNQNKRRPATTQFYCCINSPLD